MRNIYGSNVLVTGASSGIGREISTLFASEGYNVFATSRHIEEKEEVLGKGRIISYRADVTDPDSLLKLREKMESLSIIIHAAGFGIAGSAEDMEIDLARKQLDVNYFGPMTVNKIFLPMLRENERSLIIFISSIAGRVPIPFQSHYSSSKYALTISSSFTPFKLSILFDLLSKILNLKFNKSVSYLKNSSLKFVIYMFSNLSLILFISSVQSFIIELMTNSLGVYLAISSNSIGKL